MRQIVVEGIRQQIYDGSLEPGTRLVEREIAEEFNVSRLPVREALRILQNEGLLESLPTRGVVVCELTHRLVSELFDVREALEQLAAREAARRVRLGAEPMLDVTIAEVNAAVARGDIEGAHLANSRFHDEIVLLAGSQLLAQTLEPLVGRLSWLRRKVEDFDQIHEEHQRLAKAILDGDEQLAADVAREHVQASRARTLAFLD